MVPEITNITLNTVSNARFEVFWLSFAYRVQSVPNGTLKCECSHFNFCVRVPIFIKGSYLFRYKGPCTSFVTESHYHNRVLDNYDIIHKQNSTLFPISLTGPSQSIQRSQAIKILFRWQGPILYLIPHQTESCTNIFCLIDSFKGSETIMSISFKESETAIKSISCTGSALSS